MWKSIASAVFDCFGRGTPDLSGFQILCMYPKEVHCPDQYKDIIKWLMEKHKEICSLNGIEDINKDIPCIIAVFEGSDTNLRNVLSAVEKKMGIQPFVIFFENNLRKKDECLDGNIKYKMKVYFDTKWNIKWTSNAKTELERYTSDLQMARLSKLDENMAKRSDQPLNSRHEKSANELEEYGSWHAQAPEKGAEAKLETEFDISLKSQESFENFENQNATVDGIRCPLPSYPVDIRTLSPLPRKAFESFIEKHLIECKPNWLYTDDKSSGRNPCIIVCFTLSRMLDDIDAAMKGFDIPEGRKAMLAVIHNCPEGINPGTLLQYYEGEKIEGFTNILYEDGVCYDCEINFRAREMIFNFISK